MPDGQRILIFGPVDGAPDIVIADPTSAFPPIAEDPGFDAVFVLDGTDDADLEHVLARVRPQGVVLYGRAITQSREAPHGSDQEGSEGAGEPG